MTPLPPIRAPQPQPPAGLVWERALRERLWVSYKVVHDPSKPKPLKLPHGSRGRAVNWNRRLMTYAEAVAQKTRLGHDGIGYLPTPDSALVFVDFDGVLLDPDLAAQAHRWIETGGYWEVSASGTGYHAIIPRPRQGGDWTMDNAHGWMGYLGDGSKFCALTFNSVAGEQVVDIPNLVEALTAVRSAASAPRAQKETPIPERERWWTRTDPRDIRDCIRDILAHIDLPSQSDGARRDVWVKVAMSLKSTGNPWAEAAFIEWSRSQPGHVSDEDTASNWARCHPDGSMTLLTAIHFAKQQGFDISPHKAKAAPHDEAQEMADIAAAIHLATAPKPEPEQAAAPPPDLWALAEAMPAPAFVLPQYLPRGVTTSLFGKDGTGKSMLALQTAMHMAAGRAFAGRLGVQGRIEFFSVEDTLPVLAQRIRSIDETFQFTKAEKRAIADNMPDLMRRDYVRMQDTRLISFDRDGAPVLTPFMRAIAEHVRTVRPQLVIFDPISDVYGDEENVRQKVAAFMRMLNMLAADHDMSVLLLGHPAKAADSEYSGSGAWSSKSRSRLLLEAPDEDAPNLITLSHRKASWGPQAPDLMLHRTANGVLLPMSSDDAAKVEAEAETPMRVMIIDTIKAAAAAGLVCVLATNQSNNIGKMVQQFNRLKKADWRAITDLAARMAADGVLVTQGMDGQEGRPMIRNAARVVKRGLWVA